MSLKRGENEKKYFERSQKCDKNKSNEIHDQTNILMLTNMRIQ